MKKVLLIVLFSIPLPGCSTLNNPATIAKVREQTKNVCAVAGQAFGWEVIDVIPDLSNEGAAQ